VKREGGGGGKSVYDTRKGGTCGYTLRLEKVRLAKPLVLLCPPYAHQLWCMLYLRGERFSEGRTVGEGIGREGRKRGRSRKRGSRERG
jgi:hypothetical protein